MVATSEKSAIEEFLEKAGGNWLRADHVKVGDKLKILTEPVVDDKTFDRPYLVLEALLERTGEQFRVRLGPKNVNRIAETLGKKSWKDQYLEVISIESYPGLGRKGILFRGVKAGSEPAKSTAKPAGPQLSPETIDAIRNSRDICEMGIPLNESDFSVLSAGVRAELLRHGFVEKRVEGDTAYYFFVKEKCAPYFAEG